MRCPNDPDHKLLPYLDGMFCELCGTEAVEIDKR